MIALGVRKKKRVPTYMAGHKAYMAGQGRTEDYRAGQRTELRTKRFL